MFKKLLVPFLVLIAIPLSAADKRTLVTLTGSTVADVICSERNGHIGFNMPLAPHFTKRGIFESFPKGMTEFPALYKTVTGTLTTAAMIRFIEQGHTLFTNKTEQSNYKEALNECIQAYKEWYKDKTEDTAAKLAQKEDDVFTHLKKLSLANKETREKLEKIISTPVRNMFVRGVHSLVLPKRAYVAKQKNGAFMIKKALPITNFLKTIITHITSFIILNGLAVTPIAIPFIANEKTTIKAIKAIIANEKKDITNALKNIETIFKNIETILDPFLKKHETEVKVFDWCTNAADRLIMLSIILTTAASFTDFKLAPEPGDGIKVVINYVSPEAA